MATMNEFVLEFYKRLIFREMPDDQFDRFSDYIKNQDFNGNMKQWLGFLEKSGDEYVTEPDPRDSKKKIYKRKELPNPEAGGDMPLDDNEWKKLYVALNDTVQSMAADRVAHPDKYKTNKQANDFLDAYFGSLFSYTKANDSAKSKIDELLDLLKNNKRVEGLLVSDKYYGLLDKDFTFEDLINGIEKKEYDTDPAFRERMIRVADALSANTQSSTSVWYGTFGKSLDFSAIRYGFETDVVSPAKLSQLKNKYSFLLQTLYEKPNAFKAFAENDSSKISRMLEDAKKFVDYNDKDSKSYVTPKHEEKLTLPQAISKWRSDTYENYFKKFTTLRGDHIFVSQYAKLICKAIDKENIKPTDGIDKIIDSASAIKKFLSEKASSKAADQFDWMINTINALKPDMKKTISKALSNGRQMQILVSELALKAVPNKMDEAKTAMEVLSVMQYGYTTSKIMDAFNKSDFTLFSDKDLSWNQTEAGKFISAAMDKTIKLALKTVGYTITIAGNSIRKIGTKFKKNSKRITKAKQKLETNFEKRKTGLTNEKTQYQTERATLNTEQTTELENYRATEGLTSGSFADVTADLETSKIPTAKTKTDEAKSWFDASVEDLNEQLERFDTFSASDKTIANDIYNQLNSDEGILTIDPATVASITDPGLKKAVEDVLYFQPDFVDAKNDLEKRQKQLSEFKTRENDIKEFDDLITRTDAEIAKLGDSEKKKYDELMAYWDFLVSGKMNSHWGNTKKKQKDHDKIADYENAYGKIEKMSKSQYQFHRYYKQKYLS